MLYLFSHWRLWLLDSSANDSVGVGWPIDISNVVAKIDSKVLVVDLVDVVQQLLVMLLFLHIFVDQIFEQRVLDDILVPPAKLHGLRLPIWIKLVVVLRLLEDFWLVMLCRRIVLDFG